MVQWLAIGLSFVAVAVILRYARQPRCDVCERRHAPADVTGTIADVGLAELPASEPGERSAINWRAE